MDVVRLIRLIVFSLVVLALCGGAIAGAKQKPFKPQAGSYSGTAEVEGKAIAVSGRVTTSPNAASVYVAIPATSKCDDGSSSPFKIEFAPRLKGRTFTYHGGEGDINGGYYHYKLDGTFTSVKAFKGTVSRSGEGCTTGTISFALHKG